MRFEYAPGATPIDLDEAKGLIPEHLTLQRVRAEITGRRLRPAPRRTVTPCFWAPSDRWRFINSPMPR